MEGLYVNEDDCLQLVVGAVATDGHYSSWDIYGVSKKGDRTLDHWYASAVRDDASWDMDKNQYRVVLKMEKPSSADCSIVVADECVYWHDNTKWRRLAFSPFQFWMIHRYHSVTRMPLTLVLMRFIVHAFHNMVWVVSTLCFPVESLCNQVSVEQ